MLITEVRYVASDGAYDKLYGFPFPFISNGYAFTHHFDIYVLALLGDLLLYFAFSIALLKAVEQAGIKLKLHGTIVSLGILMSVFWMTYFISMSFESTFKLVNDFNLKILDRQYHIGTYPW